jgi:hypothetical protein
MAKKELTDAQKAKLKRMVARGSKINLDKPKAKASTSYSPAPMSDAAKRKASRAGAEKARQYKDLPPRRPSPNPARTSYSPQPMTEFDKRKAGARGKATAKKTAPKSTASKIGAVAGKVAKRVKTTAREARDVVTAVSTTARMAPLAQTGMPVKKTFKNIGKQIKEVGTAATKGKKGTTPYLVKADPYSAAQVKKTGKGRVSADVFKPKKR